MSRLDKMKQPYLDLISFDVDGTLLPGRILDHLRAPKELLDKIEVQHQLYHQAKLSYEESLEAQFALLAGMKPSEITPNPEQLPFIRDFRSTLERFNLRGIHLVILTDNPTFIVEPLKTYGFQGIMGSQMETRDSVLTGQMQLLTNKFHALQHYCMEKGIGIEHCAHVGDGVNDVVAFKEVGVSVAFNSHQGDVSKAATHSVKGDSLLGVYNVLEQNLRHDIEPRVANRYSG